jgi:hypothetical protein
VASHRLPGSVRRQRGPGAGRDGGPAALEHPDLARPHAHDGFRAGAWNAALSADGLSAELLADGVTAVPVG